MAEYIDLNNTEVLAEAGENAKLVVEKDGELKRIPASAVGQVKTVNGVEPDESGNVGVSYNNLLDKPFYDDSIVIEWDGNIGDRVHVATDSMGTWVKMTDRVLTAEEIIGASYEASYGSAGTFVEENVVEYEGAVVAASDCPGIVCVPSDNFDYGGFITFSEKGTYFVDQRKADGQYYCTKFVKNKIKPLDAKFLPEGAGGMVVNFTLDTTGTTSLKADKPFAEVWETIKSNKSVSAYMVVSVSGAYSATLLSMVAATDPSDVDGKQLIAFMTLDTTGDNVKVLTLKFYSDESVEVKNHTLENYGS